MNYTNRFKIESLSVQRALTADEYDMKHRPSNVFSCTEIIDAPKAKILNKRHDHELTVDISQNFWLLDGSAVHYSLEMANRKYLDNLSEERIYVRLHKTISRNWEFDVFTRNKDEIMDEYGIFQRDGVTFVDWYNTADLYVSVKFDNYESATGTLEDYKRTPVWEVIYGLKESRMQQLNIGAFAMSQIGFQVKKLRSALFLKSWDEKDYKADQKRAAEFHTTGKYPPIPYAEFEETPWSEEKIKKYILDRVTLHNMANVLSDDEIPECDRYERWDKDEAYAVMKIGADRATKVFKVGEYTAEEACDAAEQLCMEKNSTAKKNEVFEVEHRPATSTRCLKYCPARTFCHFGKNLITE